MDENKKNEDLTVTPEELNAEAESMKEIKEDELRSELATKMGLDPDVDSEVLDKLVEHEKSNREKLSGAIKQKINWRKRAETKISDKDPDKKDKDKSVEQSPEEVSKMVDIKLQERLDERDLKELNLPEAIETEVKTLAKFKGISVREAAKLPYITNMITEAEKAERINNASPKRNKKGDYSVNVDPSKPLNPADFDFNSPEGVKAWNDAKKSRSDFMAKQQG